LHSLKTGKGTKGGEKEKARRGPRIAKRKRRDENKEQ